MSDLMAVVLVAAAIAAPLVLLGVAALLLGARADEKPLPPPVGDSRSSIQRFRRMNGNA